MEQFSLALKIELNSSSSTPQTPFPCQFAPSLAKATEQDSSQLPGQISLTTGTAISALFVFFFFFLNKKASLWKDRWNLLGMIVFQVLVAFLHMVHT